MTNKTTDPQPPDHLSEYLNAIGQHALLSPEEEQALARRIELSKTVAGAVEKQITTKAPRPNTAAAHAIFKYGNQQIAGTPEERRIWGELADDALPEWVKSGLKSAAEPARLEKRIETHFGQIIRDGYEAHEQFVKANLRLVVSIARRAANRGLDLMELIQEGNAGLIRAVDRYDHRSGNRFSTYATWWIWQHVERAIGLHARTIRVPAGALTRAHRLLTVTDQLSAQLGRNPTDEEIGVEMGITSGEVARTRWLTREVESLDQPRSEDDDTPGHELLADPNAPDPEVLAMADDLRNRLESLLDDLPEREATVLRLRFGLGDNINRTLEEVSRHIGVTRQSANYIEKRALKRLRANEETRNLLIFLER